MAFLAKKNGKYLIGDGVSTIFDPSNPPLTKAGKIPVAVQRAVAGGRNHYSRTKWISLGVKREDEARALLKDYEAKNAPGKKLAYDDVLFSDAVKKVSGYFVARPSFEMRETYVIRQFENFFAGCYVHAITTEDLERYEAKELSDGNTVGTIERKLSTLRTLFKLFKKLKLFRGESPFDGFELKNADEADKPREITLEDLQQQRLIWGVYDPGLHRIYEECRDEVRKRHDGHKNMQKWLQFGRNQKFQEYHWFAFKTHGRELAELGYGNDELAHRKAFEHAKFQSQRKATDCQDLRDIVILAVTNGPRRGEIVGVASRKRGVTLYEGGLKVGNWDRERQTLTVIRTKKKAGSVKRSEWAVTPFIAAMLDRHCAGRQPNEPIFQRTGKNVHSFRTAFNEAVAFADIWVETTNDEGMKEMVRPRFADLRHVATCNMLDSGLTVEGVTSILGHSSTAMVTRVYNNRQKLSTKRRQAVLIAAGMDQILGSHMEMVAPALDEALVGARRDEIVGKNSLVPIES